MKRHDRVLEKIGRLKERYSGVASQYKIKIEKAGDIATEVHFKRQDKAGVADAAGKSVRHAAQHFSIGRSTAYRAIKTASQRPMIPCCAFLAWIFEQIFRCGQILLEVNGQPVTHYKKARLARSCEIGQISEHAMNEGCILRGSP